MRWGIRFALFAIALLAFPGAAAAEFAPLSRFSEFGGGPGQLSSPAGAAVAANGDLYVADSGNDRIAVFSGEGTPFFAFGEAGEGKLAGPTAVALGGPFVFVADTGNTRIAVFEDDGEFLSSFPTATPPKDVIVGPDGDLYVVVDERVEVFTTAGGFVRSIGDEGLEQLDKPVALASRDGEIFVADQGEDTIERFELSGDYLGGFSVESDPSGVAMACQSNVFVVEEESLFARVARFGEPGTPPPPCLASPVVIAAPALLPSSRFRFARLVKNRSNGSAILYVRVPGPGRLILHGRGVRRLVRSAPGAMVLRLPIKPKVRLRHYLKRHGKGRIRVEVTYKPLGGTPRTLEKAIVLRRHRS
jgi:subtilisin family serine protease